MNLESGRTSLLANFVNSGQLPTADPALSFACQDRMEEVDEGGKERECMWI